MTAQATSDLTDGRRGRGSLEDVLTTCARYLLRLTQTASLGGALHLPSWTVVVGSKRPCHSGYFFFFF